MTQSFFFILGMGLTATDLCWRRLPNLIILPAIALGIYLTGNLSFALLMFFIGALFYSKGIIAGGDVKLLAMFGAFMGHYALIALALSIILLKGYRKTFNCISSLPYAPFLFVGSLFFYVLK